MSSITVAIPTYNGERHIGEALRGILDQEDAAFELLVCDDCSDDRTLEIVRALAGDRARIVTGSERVGLAGNWNRCMAESRTPWVAIFHQDDVMRPGHLRDHLAAVRDDDEWSLGLVTSPSDVIDENSEPIPDEIVQHGGGSLGFPMPNLATMTSPPLRPDKCLIYPPGVFAEGLSMSNDLRCSAVTTSKCVHEAVGGFDPSYRYVVDWDFWVRVSERFGVAAFPGPGRCPSAGTRRARRIASKRPSRPGRDRTTGGKLATLDKRFPKFKLGRAYLNRAYDALQVGRIDLAASVPGRSVRLGSVTHRDDPRRPPTRRADGGLLAPGIARRLYRGRPNYPALA